MMTFSCTTKMYCYVGIFGRQDSRSIDATMQQSVTWDLRAVAQAFLEVIDGTNRRKLRYGRWANRLLRSKRSKSSGG